MGSSCEYVLGVIPSLILHTCFDSSDLGEAQRIRHSQVPVQWYTAEKGDADVDISVEDEAEQLAALLTVDPVIVVEEVVDPKRKRDDVEEVGYWQVDQVDAELVALTDLEERRERRGEIKLREEIRVCRVLFNFCFTLGSHTNDHIPERWTDISEAAVQLSFSFGFLDLICQLLIETKLQGEISVSHAVLIFQC